MRINQRLTELERQSSSTYKWYLGDTLYRKDGKFIPCPYLDKIKVDDPNPLVDELLNVHGVTREAEQKTLDTIVDELGYPHESWDSFLMQLKRKIARDEKRVVI